MSLWLLHSNTVLIVHIQFHECCTYCRRGHWVEDLGNVIVTDKSTKTILIIISSSFAFDRRMSDTLTYNKRWKFKSSLTPWTFIAFPNSARKHLGYRIKSIPTYSFCNWFKQCVSMTHFVCFTLFRGNATHVVPVDPQTSPVTIIALKPIRFS